MEKWSGKIALVTGASVGIGAAIAVKLASHGMTVVGAARRPNLIEELQKQVKGSGKIIGRKCDFNVRSEIEELFSWVEKNVGPIAVLVNNAAVLHIGTIHEMEDHKNRSIEDLTSLMNINVNAYMICSRLAAKSMMDAKIDGHIININSVAGHIIPKVQGLQVFNMYSVSKHAVRALTEVTRQEMAMAKNKIRVTSISPGAVRTDMVLSWASDPKPESPVPDISAFPFLEPEDVADTVTFALMASPRTNISELTVQPVGEIIG